MKHKLTLLSCSALLIALSACSSPYSDWEAPNVVRRNQQPAATPKRSQQVQPDFRKPTATKKTPARRTQVQPEFTKPEPRHTQPVVVQQAPKPVVEQQAPKPTPVVVTAPAKPKRSNQVQPDLPKKTDKKTATQAPATKKVVKRTPARSTQVQPDMQPRKVVTQQPVTRTATTRPGVGVPFSVMTPQEKVTHPVMPGQNRALKRRR